MKEKTTITISEKTKIQQTEGVLKVVDAGISVEKSIKEERKKLYLEYIDAIEDLKSDGIDLDSCIKRLEREMFYLEKARDSLKSEIVVKKALKQQLMEIKAKEAGKPLVELDKEIFLLNINCNLYNDAIRFKRKTIDAYKEKKTRAHQSIKRMRTRERHRMENMTFMEIDE